MCSGVVKCSLYRWVYFDVQSCSVDYSRFTLMGSGVV